MENPIRSDKIAAREVRYVWGERVPIGMPSLIAGRPGEGKSLFAAFLAAEVTKKGHTVVFSNIEDPLPQVVRPRLEAAGAKLDRVYFWSPMLPSDLDALDKVLSETKAKLVVLDPIAAHLKVSIYNDQDVRSVLSPLSKLLVKHNAAAVFIHHTVKNIGTSGHPLRAVGGSGGGLPGASRAVYIFGPDPVNSDERVLIPIKFNLAKRPTVAHFEMDEEEVIAGTGHKAKLLQAGRLLYLPTRNEPVNPWSVIGGTTGPGAGPSVDRRAEAAEWLTHYLSLGPRPVKELKEDGIQNGHSWSTIRRAADAIEVEITRTGFGPGGKSLWGLPAGHPLLAQGEDAPGKDSTDNGTDKLEGGGSG